jgi:hypothetical protein
MILHRISYCVTEYSQFWTTSYVNCLPPVPCQDGPAVRSRYGEADMKEEQEFLKVGTYCSALLSFLTLFCLFLVFVQFGKYNFD